MGANVHTTHIAVKPICAWGTIGGNCLPRHTARMAKRNLRNRQKTYLREWREHRNRTLVQVAEFLGISHGQLSRIERGQQAYNQDLLERLADLYMCDVPDLIIRNPKDQSSIWSIWDNALPGERKQIERLAETVLSFRAGGKQ